MKLKGLYLALIITLTSLTTFAQHLPVQTDSMRLEKYRTEIGLDMSVPDFETKTFDAKVIGTHLAGIIDYLMKNYNQSVYNRKLCQILKAQVDDLEKLEFELKKIQFVSAKKCDDEITLNFAVWPTKNNANVKKTLITFYFKGGVSDNQGTNELFSMMSKYVLRREQLKQ